ncbi:protein jag [Fluviispira vulneris]|uniref:protein jag n=1 Tax=Fluviispira vulneris TaxID=2763012 RepID=UPI001647A6AE|nr:R3H domain-containing nucleic acid-binding protein [Fluviispira vulneris]
MDKRQFTGKNLEEALAEAAKTFSTDKTLLCYNVIQQSSGNFFSKLFSRSVRIEAWVETSKQDLQAAAREAVRQALSKTPMAKAQNLAGTQKQARKLNPDLSKKDNSQPKTSHDNVESVKTSYNSENYMPRNLLNMKSEGVEELFDNYKKLFFSAFDVSLNKTETVIGENEAVVKVSDEFIERFLSKSDRLSLAFEHVFKRVAQKKLGDISSRISLDAGESSEKREERLIGMARSLAEKVRKTGKSVVLSSKSSQERRVIHLALDGVPGVATRSVGTGDKRRLVIYATEKRVHKNNNSNTFKNNATEKSGKPTIKQKRKIHSKKTKQTGHFQNNIERVGAVTSNEIKEINHKNDTNEISLKNEAKEKFNSFPSKDD